MPQKLLSIEQAGKALGISRATVWRRIRQGALASVRAEGRRWVVPNAVRREVSSLNRLPAFTRQHPIFKLAGAYRSGGRGPGASDKHAILDTRD